ncbi:MAG: DNA polymerase III subunit delta [Gemmataceae bacterium]
MDALKFLERSSKAKPAPIYVLTGDEDFLRRQVVEKLIADLLGDADPSFAVTTLEGEAAQWSTVKSELDTLPFLAPRRVVVIEQADPFVTEYRTQLEKHVGDENASGVLILQVKSFPSNTKLAKLVPEGQTIVCKAPQRLGQWCRDWTQKRYAKDLAVDAADMLVELVGDSMGQLDRELDKLASFVGSAPKISQDDVEQMVGRTREAEVFKIFNAVGNGDVAAAMTILERLLGHGEAPLAVLGVFSWKLRQLASVSRFARAGLTVSEALDRAGVKPFQREGVERELRHLGRSRMDRVYDWLIEADMGMKGSSPLPERIILEKLVVKLARKETAPVRG